MKKRSMWVAAAVLLPLAALVVGNPFGGHVEKRSAYEKYLLDVSGSIPVGSLQGNTGKSAGMESPDIAAFTEYIKTMDPNTGTVPAGVLSQSFEQACLMQARKSGGSGLQWVNRINTIGGRTRVIFNDPNDQAGKKVWAGSVTGGLWYNDNAYGNGEWHPVDDFWPGLAVACMAYDPVNPQTYFVGTGESQTALITYRESSTRGVGIMRSDDSGKTWKLMPSTKEWAYVTDIVVRNEHGAGVIYAGVVSGMYKGSLHESSPSDGLYRSEDGGLTWTQVLPLIEGGERPYAPSDLALSSDGQRIFVGTTYRGEDRQGAGTILYSDDGVAWTVNRDYYNMLIAGAVWERNQIPYSRPGRVMLAEAPSDPNVIYALVSGGFPGANNFSVYTDRYLLRSTNKGASWSEIPSPWPPEAGTRTLANLAWHAMTLAVDPVNPSTLWMGGLDVWRTRNAGLDWQKMSWWAPQTDEQRTHFVHADIHRIEFRPERPDELLVGTDGGLFYTGQSASESPVFEGRNRFYNTLQYYYGAIHPEAGRNFFIGGLQDNGTLLDAEFGDQYVSGAISGGDGFYCFIDENEPALLISTIYYTWISLFSFPDLQNARNIAGINYEIGTFCNPMDYDWKYNILYANGCGFAGQNANTLRIIRISQQGITPPKSTPPMEIPTNSPVPYSCIKWNINSGEDASTLYIGTEAGRLYRLAEAPVLGELTDMTSEALPVGYISSIDIGLTEDTLMLTYSNYGIPSVFVTTDGGGSWRNVEANLPDMPVRWGIFHPLNSRQVMLATEIGVWTTDDVFAPEVTWKPDVSGMANVRVDMVKFRTSDHTVMAATHGRGIFTAKWEPFFSSGKVESALGVTEVTVYPNPANGRFEVGISRVGNGILQIMDAAGRVVTTEEIKGQPGSWRKSFNLTGEPAGTYLVRVQAEGRTTVSRVVLE